VTAAVGMGLLAWCGRAQNLLTRDMLTNRDVITLANAGLSEQFIIQVVNTSRTRFDTTAEGLADLAKHGITEPILWAVKNAKPPQCCGAEETGKPDAPNDGTIRVFVDPAPDSRTLGQAHPQTAEVMKTFGESCHGLVVTNRKNEATFTVVLEREAGKLMRRDSKMVVFDRSGQMVYDASTRTVGNAVRGFCASVDNGLAQRMAAPPSNTRLAAR